MKHKVINTIERHQMIRKGDTVVIGVSGGADSMALLSVLYKLKSQYSLELIAGHINHGIRGDEAGRDEKLVRDYCRKLKVECRVLEVNVPKEAKENSEGLEECGRRIRYEFFNSISVDAKIATAHTLSDRLETTLFNLARGSTLTGLCSLPAKRDNIIRPLIECSRSEIEKYCEENDISYVFDSTNNDNNYSRNRIRNVAVPALKKINSAMEKNYFQCVSSLEEDERFFQNAVDVLLKDTRRSNGYSAKILTAAPVSLRRRAIIRIIKEHAETSANYDTILAVEKLLESEGVIQLSSNFFISVKNEKLNIEHSVENYSEWQNDFSIGEHEIPFGRIKFSIVNKKDLVNIQKVHKEILACCADYDKMIGKVVFGSKPSGAKIRLSKRGCTKAVRRLYSEAGIPERKRNLAVTISDEAGVFFAEGFGSAERTEIRGETERVLLIEIERKNFSILNDK